MSPGNRFPTRTDQSSYLWSAFLLAVYMYSSDTIYVASGYCKPLPVVFLYFPNELKKQRQVLIFSWSDIPTAVGKLLASAISTGKRIMERKKREPWLIHPGPVTEWH